MQKGALTMKKTIHWDAVLQSIVDTWLTLIIITGALAVGLSVFVIIRKRRKK